MFDLVLHLVDLSLQLRIRVVKDNCGNDVSRDTTGATEVGLLGYVNVGDVLILAQKREVEDDFKRFGISSKDNKVSNTSVQTFCGLVGSLFCLFIESSLVAQVNDLLGQLVISLGPCAALTCSLTSVISLLGLDDLLLVGLNSTLGLLLALL